MTKKTMSTASPCCAAVNQMNSHCIDDDGHGHQDAIK